MVHHRARSRLGTSTVLSVWFESASSATDSTIRVLVTLILVFVLHWRSRRYKAIWALEMASRAHEEHEH